MIIDAVTKAVDFVKIVGKCNSRVFLVEIRKDLVDSRWDFLKKWVVDKPNETVKGELKTS